MAVHSGRLAVVNGVNCMRKWTISETMQPAKGVGSNTAFGTARHKGPREWSGNYGALGGVPPLLPGESAAGQFFTGPDNDVSGVGYKVSGNIVCSQVAITWSWANGELISYQTDFLGDLALTRAAAATAITDATTPAILSPCGAAIKYSLASDGVTFTDWPNAVQAVLTMTNSVQEYVNSSTCISGALWKGRKPGILDFTLAVTEQNEAPTLVMGSEYIIRLYIDATTYWELKWAMVHDASGLDVDRETGKIIQQTANLSMQSNLIATGAQGHILKPGGATFWGT